MQSRPRPRVRPEIVDRASVGAAGSSSGVFTGGPSRTDCRSRSTAQTGQARRRRGRRRGRQPVGGRGTRAPAGANAEGGLQGLPGPAWLRVRERLGCSQEKSPAARGGGQGRAGRHGAEGPGAKGAYLLESGGIYPRRDSVREPGARTEKSAGNRPPCALRPPLVGDADSVGLHPPRKHQSRRSVRKRDFLAVTSPAAATSLP